MNILLVLLHLVEFSDGLRLLVVVAEAPIVDHHVLSPHDLALHVGAFWQQRHASHKLASLFLG